MPANSISMVAQRKTVKGLTTVPADMQTIFGRDRNQVFVFQFAHQTGNCAHGNVQLCGEAAAADRPAVQHNNWQAASALLPEHCEIFELGQAFEAILHQTEQLQEAIHRQEISLLTLEKKQQETEKIALQQQTDPHFLCNILLSIDMMIRTGETERAEKTVRMLGKYLRGLLGSFADTTLEAEFSHIEAYMEIQKIRFGDSLTYTFTMEDRCAALAKIPRFLIQPIVENALIHGAVAESPLYVEVSASSSDKEVQITVRDNGKGISKEQLADVCKQLEDETDGSHIGLRNVQDRIRLRWGKDYGVSIKSTPGTGTCVLIRIPKNSGKENEDVSTGNH